MKPHKCPNIPNTNTYIHLYPPCTLQALSSVAAREAVSTTVSVQESAAASASAKVEKSWEAVGFPPYGDSGVEGSWEAVWVYGDHDLQGRLIDFLR